MKDYFHFQLKGIRILPVWLVFYILVLIPAAALINHDWPYIINLINPAVPVVTFLTLSFREISFPPSFNLHFGYSSWPIFFYLVFLTCFFYFNRIVLKSIGLRDSSLQCNYRPGNYLVIAFGGLFLSIITLGIYAPWFYRNLHRFFIDNLSWKESSFYFRGKGKDLLEISFLLLIAPLFGLLFLMTLLVYLNVSEEIFSVFNFSPWIIFPTILIFYNFFYYNWRVNLSFHSYTIRWDLPFWPSIGKIFLEFLLTVITLGIYGPLTFLRLYQYFITKTRGIADEGKIVQFGYDLQCGRDWLFIWGQLLLMIISFGIYFPWAFCSIAGLILRKSYVEIPDGKT